MKRPTMYGWFHLIWFAIMIIACILIYIFRKKLSMKTVNITLLVFGIALIIFEIYKQIVFSFNYNGGQGNSTWTYRWYAFPFQFCSTPMYLMTLAGILRKGKVHDALLCYLATFSLFAGLSVMFYPGDVFTSMIGINIQTMFWHSGMVIIGFMLLATKSIKFSFKSCLKASIVFITVLAIALVMNIIWHYCGTDATFNMFYISPYYPCTLIILDTVYASVPYVVFLLIYILGFMLISFIIMGIVILLSKLENKLISRHKNMDNGNNSNHTKASD